MLFYWFLQVTSSLGAAIVFFFFVWSMLLLRGWKQGISSHVRYRCKTGSDRYSLIQYMLSPTQRRLTLNNPPIWECDTYSWSAVSTWFSYMRIKISWDFQKVFRFFESAWDVRIWKTANHGLSGIINSN